MRFVPANCIREGMILGQTLYGPNGELLLRAGTVIKDAYIDKIKSYGYNGTYIDDDLTKDIEIQEIISAELKNRTVNALKNVFIQIESKGNNSAQNNRTLKTMKSLVENIFNEISEHKNFMVNVIDIKIFDDYTFFHSTNVTVLSLVLGLALGLKKRALLDLGTAALFHDIGKVFISKNILNKNGPLTADEFDEIKCHSSNGYAHLKDVLAISPKSYVGVLQHHEKFDGLGYPHGLVGKDISLFGRIIAIADVYDALTSDRPYRKGLLPSEAMEFIMGNGGVQFDHDLVKVFAQKIAPYPIGTYVHLSDGREGFVVDNYAECCLRPRIKIVKDSTGVLKQHYHLDLKNDITTFTVIISGMDRGDTLAFPFTDDANT